MTSLHKSKKVARKVVAKVHWGQEAAKWRAHAEKLEHELQHHISGAKIRYRGLEIIVDMLVGATFPGRSEAELRQTTAEEARKQIMELVERNGQFVMYQRLADNEKAQMQEAERSNIEAMRTLRQGRDELAKEVTLLKERARRDAQRAASAEAECERFRTIAARYQKTITDARRALGAVLFVDSGTTYAVDTDIVDSTGRVVVVGDEIRIEIGGGKVDWKVIERVEFAGGRATAYTAGGSGWHLDKFVTRCGDKPAEAFLAFDRNRRAVREGDYIEVRSLNAHAWRRIIKIFVVDGEVYAHVMKNGVERSFLLREHSTAPPPPSELLEKDLPKDRTGRAVRMGDFIDVPSEKGKITFAWSPIVGFTNGRDVEALVQQDGELRSFVVKDYLTSEPGGRR